MARTLEQIWARHREIARAQRATAEAPLPDGLYDLLESAAGQYGDAPALVFFEQGTTLSYRDLLAAVDRAAAAFAALGIAKGQHVAVMLPNIPEFPVIWLALARLGCAMAPVNVRYTARELDYVCRDSDSVALVIHADFAPALAGIADVPVPVVISVGGDVPRAAHRWEALTAAADPKRVPAARGGVDDLINIQYTSGTTGFPKGCMLPQRYWLYTARSILSQTPETPRRIFSSIFFFYMDAMYIVPMAFLIGASVHMPARPRTAPFWDWARDQRVEWSILFEPVFKLPPTPGDAKNDLKHVYIFGFTKESHAELERRFGVRAREMYGMTENGSVLFMPPEDDHMTGSGSCGIPSAGRCVKIMADDGLPAPTGQVGELWMRGPAIMHGYYKKDEANAESFRDGWFRTGDLARVDADGYHYIVGRVKDMVRKGGENIAAREVEAVLRAMAEIKEAAVVPVPDGVVGEEVKAYVQLQAGLTRDDVPPARIMAHCEANLARFKLPRFLAYQDSFVYTASDRVEKKTLTQGVQDLRAGSYDVREKRWL